MSKISIKKDYADGQVLYGGELNANNQVIESGVNDNFTRIQGLDSSKASATDVNNVLATKVSNITYNADKISMQNQIDAKASITYVNTQLAGKANTSALDSKLDKTSAGSLSALNTTDKSSLVAAINEVNRETLPIATTSSLGGIKPDGTTITVDVDGTAHAVGGGEGGTSDYTSLSNRPSINDVVLVAGLDAADLNLAKASDVELDLLAKANTADVYTKTETNSEITEALTDLTTKTYVDTGLSTKADADDVYTKAETDSAINTATSGKADASDVETSLATKQDKLTAGENIAITDNVISSTGGATIDQSNIAPLDPATGDLWIDTGDTNYLMQISDIIESGSNTNGNYIKFADGTMICTKRMFLDSDTVTGFNPVGVLYYNVFDLGDLPQTFTSILSKQATLDTHVNNYAIFSGYSDTTNTSLGKGSLLTGSNARFTCYINCLIIGKWK